MINVRDHAVLDLTFGRRGEGRRTHGGPLHRTGHALFHEQHRICRHREIRQRTHRSDDLTQGEEKYQRNVWHIHSLNHESNHNPAGPAQLRCSVMQAEASMSSLPDSPLPCSATVLRSIQPGRHPFASHFLTDLHQLAPTVRFSYFTMLRCPRANSSASSAAFV